MSVKDTARVSQNNCTLDSECTTTTGLNQSQNHGNFTESTDKMTEGQSSLYMTNWLVVILIGGTVLVFVAGLFIKRQQVIKERQRREEQYLAYFHSILPHSRLYGKIESSDNTSALTENDKKKSTDVIISNEDSNFTTERGLREIWEGVNTIGLIAQTDSEQQHSNYVTRGKKTLHKLNVLRTNNNNQETTIPKNHENMIDRISVPEIAISIECDVHREKFLANSLDPDQTPCNTASGQDPNCLTLPVTNEEIDITVHKDQNETGIAVYSSMSGEDNRQESSYIIWI